MLFSKHKQILGINNKLVKIVMHYCDQNVVD